MSIGQRFRAELYEIDKTCLNEDDFKNLFSQSRYYKRHSTPSFIFFYAKKIPSSPAIVVPTRLSWALHPCILYKNYIESDNNMIGPHKVPII